MVRKRSQVSPPSRPPERIVAWLLGLVVIVALVGLLLLRGREPVVGIATSDALVLGSVDTISSQRVTGWTLDAGTPAKSAEVAIYVDDGLFVRKTTDVQRADVNQFFSITGIHGFDISLAEAFADGQKHQVRIEGYAGDRHIVLRDESVQP